MGLLQFIHQMVPSCAWQLLNHHQQIYILRLTCALDPQQVRSENTHHMIIHPDPTGNICIIMESPHCVYEQDDIYVYELYMLDNRM